MKIQTMKRTIIVAALAGFILTSCSENSREATTHETAQHDSTTHEETEAAETEIVVQAPDYTSVAGPVKEQLKAVVESYLTLKDNLVASDAQKASESAKAVLAVAEKTDLSTLQGEQKTFAEERLTTIKKAATTMAGTTDIEAQRTELQSLSEATFALAKAFGAADETLYYQFCPMAFNDQGAYWLSSKEEIRNPYFGAAMLKCGSNKEVYKQ
ncbi:DUF3347 domain-containing protein [Pontibacter sp. H259]|uniref:DUF3347 domain-containing protein n=1 Tax=Pontibacter sp. H259 TaxID=3133421 RepID=UPI0030C50C44